MHKYGNYFKRINNNKNEMKSSGLLVLNLGITKKEEFHNNIFEANQNYSQIVNLRDIKREINNKYKFKRVNIIFIRDNKATTTTTKFYN